MTGITAAELILPDQTIGEVTHAKKRDVLFHPEGTPEFEIPDYAFSPSQAITPSHHKWLEKLKGNAHDL